MPTRLALSMVMLFTPAPARATARVPGNRSVSTCADRTRMASGAASLSLMEYLSPKRASPFGDILFIVLILKVILESSIGPDTDRSPRLESSSNRSRTVPHAAD